MVQLIKEHDSITCRIQNVLKEKKQKPEECPAKELIVVMLQVIVTPQALFIRRQIAMMTLIIWSFLLSPQAVLLVANSVRVQATQIPAMSRPVPPVFNQHHNNSNNKQLPPHRQALHQQRPKPKTPQKLLNLKPSFKK
jgi:hypothetical protein